MQRQTSDVTLFGAISTGVFAGLMMVIMTVTYASLIFSGDLRSFVGSGVSIGLTSIIIIGCLHTLFSSSAHLIVQIDDDTAPVFALLLSLFAASLPASLSSPELLSNLFAALFFATVVSGITLTIFGVFRFGNFVQFLPYSVMGGYFAAVGWLLLIGAITMLTRLELSNSEDLVSLFSPQMLWQWVPAVVVGVWLKVMSNRVSTGLLLGGTVAFTILVFYVVHGMLGSSPQDLMDAGLLIGPFSQENQPLLNPVTQLDWSAVRWSTSLGTVGSLASITLISLLSIILCISGLSLTTRKDLDINHELKVSGAANIASGFLGGMSALPSLSISKLAYEIHPHTSRIIGATAIVIAIAAYYVAMPAIAHIPKIALGSLLIYIGLGFVKDWLIDGYRKFGAVEYSVIPIILVVSVFAGFLQGVVTGVIAAIVLFVIKYSRARIIRYQASGADFRSNLARDVEQNKILREYGDQIQIFTLQGFLFFGTAGALYKAVLDAVDDAKHANIKYVILDFAQVIGVDSSASLNFEKLAQRLAERKIVMISTNLKSELLEILRRGGLDPGQNAFLIRHSDLDQGLEWCENDILQQQESTATEGRGIFQRIADAIPQTGNIDRLADYLKKIEVEAGAVLAEIGEQSDEVLFLESCAASAFIIDASGQERRVAGAGRGAVFGEIGFILGIPRTALVRADSAGEIYTLSRETLKTMEVKEPELASAIILYLAKIVTERLVNTTRSLRVVI